MKVFICWSGEPSRQLAECIRDWLPTVLQSATPYFAPEDVDKGSRWLPNIAVQLADSKVGLICATANNLNNEWIHFEAGALSQSLEKSYVCPLLFGVKTTDLTGPLGQFQATQFQKQDFLRLVGVINDCSEEEKVKPKILDTVFEKFWPDLKSTVEKILDEGIAEDKPIRPDREILEEILFLSRRQHRLSRRLIGAPVNPRAIDALLRAYIELHDDQANQQGDYQHTLDLLSEMHRPMEYIVDRLAHGARTKGDLLDRFRLLTYKESGEEDIDIDDLLLDEE